MGYFITNKEFTKGVFIYKDECSKMIVDKSKLLTEVFNLPSNVLSNPKLYLGNEYNIIEVDDEFIKDNITSNYNNILFLMNSSVARYNYNKWFAVDGLHPNKIIL